MRRFCNSVLCSAFLLIIIVPYIFAHRFSEERVSDMENRMLAAYPAIWTENGWNSNYIEQYENWISDNMRGRTALVECNSMLQYKLFHRIVKDDTIEGRNHWLFANEPEMFKEYQHLNLMTEPEVKEFVESMEHLSDYLSGRGIAFYYFQCIDKESIYPQEYVKGIQQFGEQSRVDQIVEGLQEGNKVTVVCPKEELLEASKENIVYYQYTDLEHWNEMGAYIGYRELVDRMLVDFPEIRILQQEDYNIYEIADKTELYGFEYPYTEMTPIYELQSPFAVEKIDERWNYLSYKEHTHYYQNEKVNNDIKILLVGDSFVRMFIKDDIAEGFRETLSIDWLNVPILNQIIDDYTPDIVVLESTEKTLGNVIACVNSIEY